ncbi:MAG TPA: GNAT family N-acetyltransferase [Anaerolineae bacterium]
MSGRADPLPRDVLITRDSRLEPNQVDQFRSIYMESFPASERDDFDELVQQILQGKRWLFTVKKGESVLGIAVLLPAITPRVHLLEYLAILRESRSRGLGSGLLNEISNHLRFSASGILLEVEAPEVGAGEEIRFRRRRIEFYLRNGAHVVECAPCYRAPNLAGPGTVDMKLMWLPLDSAPVPTGAQLADDVVAIYTKSYQFPANDPLVQRGLDDLIC